MAMSNILLIVSMPFMNACYYTYVIYLGMKINSPKPKNKEADRERNWGPEGGTFI